jgi:cystathionine beta-lyase/cystathionine gamma-synthase
MRLDPHDVQLCVSDDGPPDATGVRPTTTPIVQTSLFGFPSLQDLVDGLGAEHRTRVYSRGNNPTVEALEAKLAALERGEASKAFASGMAAISGVLLGLLEAGDHVVFVNHVYGPTLQLARHLRRFGVEHDVVLDPDPAAVAGALRPETRLLWVESPGTMLFRVADLDALARLAHERGMLACIDNTWATPLLQKPLTLGFDVVVHTATKYLGGHSDLVAGAVVSSAERVQQIFYRSFLLNGGVLPPFDAWLLLRGMRTLPARLRQHEADALVVARALAEHPAVRRVHHPALGPERDLAERQMAGYTGVFSFELVRDDFESVRRVVDGLRIPRIGVSWGGVESLVISPQRPGNESRLEAKGIPLGLIRLSVGLEGADVLVEDLTRALDALA